MPALDALSNLIAAGEVRRASLPIDPVRAIVGEAQGAGAFSSLLERATAGQIESGLPVRIDPGVGIELTPDQVERISSAVDHLTAAGAKQALVGIDGAWLRVDVENRAVVGVEALGPNAPLTNIDAIVRAPGGDDEDALAGAAAQAAKSANLNELLGALASGLVR